MICRMRFIAFFFICMILASCGNERQESRRELFVRIGTIWKEKFTDSSESSITADDVRAAIPAFLEQTTEPLVVLTLPRVQGSALLVQHSKIDNYRVFSDVQVTVTLEGGVLAETRNIGNDLMSSQNGSLPELLALRLEGDYQRALRTLDGEGHEVTLTFDCRLSELSQKSMIENCTSPGRAFKNIYEFSSDNGSLAKSEQWLNSMHGHVVIEYLRY